MLPSEDECFPVKTNASSVKTNASVKTMLPSEDAVGSTNASLKTNASVGSNASQCEAFVFEMLHWEAVKTNASQ